MDCWLAMSRARLFVYWSIVVNVPMHVIGTDGTYVQGRGLKEEPEHSEMW